MTRTTNGELMAVLARVEQKVDDNLLFQTQTHAALDKRIAAIETDMWGNGKPGVKASVDRLYNGVKIAVGVLSTLTVVSALITACNANGLVIHATKDATAVSVIRATLADIVTETPAPTATSAIPADFPLTVTLTPPEPTIPFVSPTPEFAGDGPIIEATALGGEIAQTGYYTPRRNNLNVRMCHALTCAVVRLWYIGDRRRIYMRFEDKDTQAIWLSPDPLGEAWVAYIVNDIQYGDWEPDR